MVGEPMDLFGLLALQIRQLLGGSGLYIEHVGTADVPPFHLRRHRMTTGPPRKRAPRSRTWRRVAVNGFPGGADRTGNYVRSALTPGRCCRSRSPRW